MTTLEQVLILLPQLSAAERTHVLEVLEADPQIVAARTANQEALAHLDGRVAGDDDEDDSWWSAFTDALDNDRLSNRPLFPDQASRSA